MGDSSLFVRGGSPIRPFAESLVWLWRLPPIASEPRPGMVGVGTIDDAAELAALRRDRRLAGVAILGTRPGPDQGPLPGRSLAYGVAALEGGATVNGQLGTLQGPGRALARSGLGTHALRNDDWLTIASDPLASWGLVRDHWVLPVLADFLAEMLGRPMVTMPPVGLIRYDDVPGTAPQQLKGQDKPDGRVERRLRRLISAYRDAGAKINFAICARVLADGEQVPPEQVFPRSIEAIAGAIAEGTVEPISHGYLHLDTERFSSGEVEPREFGSLPREQAHERVSAALDWAEGALGVRPPTFVAPNWTYGDGLLAALDALELPAWLPLAFGPLVEGRNAHETLVSTLNGLHRLDYRPLGALAGVGLPPYVVIHGGLADARFDTLRMPRDMPTLGRLVLKRDLSRLAAAGGLRWVTASDLLARLRAHDQVEFSGGEVRAPDGVEVVLREPTGRGR